MCDSLKQDTERDFLNMNDSETQLSEAFMPLFLYETTQNFLDSSDAMEKTPPGDGRPEPRCSLRKSTRPRALRSGGLAAVHPGRAK